VAFLILDFPSVVRERFFFEFPHPLPFPPRWKDIFTKPRISRCVTSRLYKKPFHEILMTREPTTRTRNWSVDPAAKRRWRSLDVVLCSLGIRRRHRRRTYHPTEDPSRPVQQFVSWSGGGSTDPFQLKLCPPSRELTPPCSAFFSSPPKTLCLMLTCK